MPPSLHRSPFERLKPLLLIAAIVLLADAALAHDVSESDRKAVAGIDGPAFIPFLYLGAKHMVTGYDHVAFLVGVVFYLRRLKDVVVYVSMFTIGHSLTLMGGVLLKTGGNPFLIDAIIGLSVIYKAAENLGAFRKIGWSFDPRWVVLIFGLFHGLGLATKLQDLAISENGLLTNLIGFNIGVEVGQVLVLTVVVFALNLWRTSPSFDHGARLANWLLVAVGVALVGYQLAEWIAS
ncbi:HupE/UreJ family protein [Croceibacterium aestuarii]|uniref:HupE/UreJ family protein n=1 Tax=Croceibacterium aestuarii TaxID=3064139 RepID=UPI00272E64DD|nr:HupE/UreJ family protein [Croceibacterium sp. D39]